MKSIQQQLLRYWMAMNATALQSGVHALKIYCGVAGFHEASATVLPAWSVAALDLKQGALVFAVAFGSAILDYLDANPIGKLFPPVAGQG
jgi:hypothetical protein